MTEKKLVLTQVLQLPAAKSDSAGDVPASLRSQENSYNENLEKKSVNFPPKDKRSGVT